MKIISKATLIFLLCLPLVQNIYSQSPSFKTYMNPVIPGDHPDATLTRVGNDFYTAGSSFNPTPVIYHSTDLVHWEAIAQPVKASWTLYGDTPGGGCWGGHLVYHNGFYWYFFSRSNTMYFVKADYPHGPWSIPEKVNNPSGLPYGLGYDNSVFIDDNNKWYLIVKNGQPNNGIVELGDDGQPTGVVYNLNWLNPAPSYPYSWAEGPVMWKHKGFYYYSFARDVSGGQKVMRSLTITENQASWEMLGDFFKENDPLKAGSLFTGPNHSSPVIMLNDSTYWVMHPVYAKSTWKGQGRQGLLNQVRYDANLKPTADYPVNQHFIAPRLPGSGIPWMVPKSDFFNSDSLNPEWSFLGYTQESTWSLSERPGWLRLSPKSSSKPNTLIKNDGEHNYSMITRLEFDASSVSDEAGLRIIRGDESKYVKLYSSINSSGNKAIFFSFETNKYETVNTVGNTLWLKMVRTNHSVSGFYSIDGNTWIQVGNSVDISLIDSYSDFSSWAGTRQGLYVQNRAAWFDMYIYRDAYTPVLAGCPANQYGTVPSGDHLDSIHHNDWALYAGVEFGSRDYGKAADSILMEASGLTGGLVEVWLDSIDTGTNIGTCEINSTGSWTTYRTFSAPIGRITGRHDVYLKFTGSSTGRLFCLKWIQFTARTAPQYVSACTTSDSTISVKLNKNVLNPMIPSGFSIRLNNTTEDSITRIGLNAADSSEINLTLLDKLEHSDQITISYADGSIMSIEGMELVPFNNNRVNNYIPDTTFHIYLMFGQSNMEGAGTIEAQDRMTNPRVKMLQDLTCPNLNRTYGMWYTAAPPLNRCWGKLGPGDSFGRMLGTQAPEYVSSIGLVNASVSGCNIYIYKKGCPNGLDQISQGIPFDCGYAWLLDLAKKAQQVGVIKGIIFHQGETNNTDPNWKYTVQQIVADLKSDLGLGDIPFLAGETLYAQYNSCCSAHNIEINKLPALIPNSHVISAAGLPGADYAHFTSESYRTFGERYARKMLELVYNICDSNTIESWYQFDGDIMKYSDSVIIQSNTSLVLSPHPTNLLGSWNWTGDGVSGTSREQTTEFSNEGTYIAVATYTNECGAVSRLPFKILVCDSSVIVSRYQVNNGEWLQADEITVLKGSTLVLEPGSSDTAGTWTWSGAGTEGTTARQIVNTSTAGSYKAFATFINQCGVRSRLQINIIVENEVTGVEDLRTEPERIDIYPNPSRNLITIKTNAPDNMKFETIYVTNNLGQVVLRPQPDIAGPAFSIDINSLQPGTYSLNILSGKGMVVKKFAKVK